MKNNLKTLWGWLRRLSGDDAYEQYLKHYAERHPAGADQTCSEPLSKAEFFKQWQDQKWNGINRCC